jgi:hypothetical protein
MSTEIEMGSHTAAQVTRVAPLIDRLVEVLNKELVQSYVRALRSMEPELIQELQRLAEKMTLAAHHGVACAVAPCFEVPRPRGRDGTARGVAVTQLPPLAAHRTIPVL